MRTTGIAASLLVGFLLTLSACVSPATTATTTPAIPAPAPSPEPASIQAVAVAPEPACPLPPPQAAPGKWNFIPGPTEYVVEVTPASGAGSFTISELQVYPIEAAVGDDLTFSFVVTNTAIQPANYTFVLKFDNAVIQSQDVSLDAGSSKKVELSILARYGEFKVTAGELTATFRVFF